MPPIDGPSAIAPAELAPAKAPTVPPSALEPAWLMLAMGVNGGADPPTPANDEAGGGEAGAAS